ncbi:hypothetical protein [Achromobacter ruhlandii]|uniref:hypothetical protein n=1 Tax=Achromobacter ruhlandii TaxID=72557 RepID=UPI001EEF0740|nr:hypothetical protein [Achromobacter ruhlandii]
MVTTIGKLWPDIHMPRWICRLALEVTGVRLERLQDRCDGTRSPAPSTGHGDLEKVVISYTARTTVESVQALIGCSKQKKAA